MRRKIKFKCDFFGFGNMIGGAAQAAGSVAGAKISAEATKEAAQKSYDAAIATNNANIEMVDRTNAANLQLSQQQNQWNIEQWQRQNEYNSPAHQMTLYKQAGLNPVLAQGNFSPAQELQSAPLANQVAPQISNPMSGAAEIIAQGGMQQGQMIGNAISSAVNAAKGLAELKKIGSETKLTESQVQKSAEEIRSLTLQNKWYDKLSDADLSLKMQQVDQIRANIGLIKSQSDKVKIDADLQRFELGIKEKTIDVILAMPQAQLDLVLAQITASKAQGSLAFSQSAINKIISDSGTQLPTVNNPLQQFLWDAYYFLTDDGSQNIFEVLVDKLGGTDVAKGYKAYKKIKKAYTNTKKNIKNSFDYTKTSPMYRGH